MWRGDIEDVFDNRGAADREEWFRQPVRQWPHSRSLSGSNDDSLHYSTPTTGTH
jgi:hypothetical protein